MRFTPKTEQQIEEENLLPAGTYDFECVEAEEAVSKKGNEMIKVKLRVYRDDGSFIVLTDYLLEAFAKKLLHFCKAGGLMGVYEDGHLTTHHCKGVIGKAVLDIQPAEGKYAAKNIVEDYTEAGPAARKPTPEARRPQPPATRPKPEHDPNLDVEGDDIPF